VTFDGSGSIGPVPITSWRWDLDDDGQCDDASGEFATVGYDYLVSDLGLGIGTHTIGLEVSNLCGYPGWDTAVLEIVPEPVTLALICAGALAILRRRRA
jgi:hypothetical protein